MTKAKEKIAEKSMRTIYVGPNLSGGRMLHATAFRDGVPGYLKNLRAQHPEIDELIVPFADFAAALENTQRPGTPEHQAYQTLSKLSGKEQ